MKFHYTIVRTLALTSLAALPVVAWAHPGHEQAGFLNGMLHPLSGVDHVLAMAGVGVVAAIAGGRGLWLVPGSFLLMMCLGGLLGASGFAVQITELVIAGSVIGIGALMAGRWTIPVSILMTVVGGFAVFHGLAHGGEMPAGISGVAFSAGFVVATAMLHAAGITIGNIMERLTGRIGLIANRMSGVSIGVAGLIILGQSL